MVYTEMLILILTFAGLLGLGICIHELGSDSGSIWLWKWWDCHAPVICSLNTRNRRKWEKMTSKGFLRVFKIICIRSKCGCIASHTIVIMSYLCGCKVRHTLKVLLWKLENQAAAPTMSTRSSPATFNTSLLKVLYCPSKCLSGSY